MRRMGKRKRTRKRRVPVTALETLPPAAEVSDDIQRSFRAQPMTCAWCGFRRHRLSARTHTRPVPATAHRSMLFASGYRGGYARDPYQ